MEHVFQSCLETRNNLNLQLDEATKRRLNWIRKNMIMSRFDFLFDDPNAYLESYDE
jgi:hypothetical protein